MILTKQLAVNEVCKPVFCLFAHPLTYSLIRPSLLLCPVLLLSAAALGEAPPSSTDGAGGEGDQVEEETLYFKVLCPQSITGLIIGRGGSIINQINASCGAKIKLSQNHEFFPGSTDRILLCKHFPSLLLLSDTRANTSMAFIVSGSKRGIANGVKELVSRIAEAPDKKPQVGGMPAVDMYGMPIPPANRTRNGSFQIRVLIPKNASACVIGRQGSVIKQLSESSGCKFQLGDDTDPYETRERVVAISSSTVDSLVLGAQTLMNHVLDDPRVRTYFNLSTVYNSRGVSTSFGQPSGPALSMPAPQHGMIPNQAMPNPYMISPMMNSAAYSMVPYGMMPTMNIPPQMTTNNHPRGPVPSAAPPYGAYPYAPNTLLFVHYSMRNDALYLLLLESKFRLPEQSAPVNHKKAVPMSIYQWRPL
eukprot:scaffold2799_cov159-Ochromonas_danica.AAC.32